MVVNADQDQSDSARWRPSRTTGEFGGMDADTKAWFQDYLEADRAARPHRAWPMAVAREFGGGRDEEQWWRPRCRTCGWLTNERTKDYAAAQAIADAHEGSLVAGEGFEPPTSGL